MATNVEPTAQVIDQAAETFRRAAAELDGLAAKMRDKQDLSYASEAVNAALNVLRNARLDLLVTRSLREYEKSDVRAEAKQ